MRSSQLVSTLLLGATLIAPGRAAAQGGGRGAAVFHLGTTEIVSVEPMDDVPAIAGAPFTADATTEFTQLLSDGNRIDRRFTTSLARDGRGRTRSEQEVAMLGPLAVLEKKAVTNWRGTDAFNRASSEPPRFTVITDPVESVTYTLDERLKEARRNRTKITMIQSLELNKLRTRLETIAQTRRRDADPSAPVVESLGTRTIEGVSAEGTRSTTTIPAGEIGNLNPIHIVTERWFSKELQMAVLITRRDPRSGDTVYRLSSIVRAEPPPDLFTVPADYRVVDVPNKLDRDKLVLERETKKVEAVKRGQE